MWKYNCNRKLIIIAFCLTTCVCNCFAQSGWSKWGKNENSYRVQSDFKERDYSLNDLNPGEAIVKSTAIIYWFFFSDLDGDNCPFHPSCSNFYIEAMKNTNIVQGTLMFFDRFTRDATFTGRQKHYPVYKNRKFFDPPDNYNLNSTDIKYYFPSTLILEEE